MTIITQPTSYGPYIVEQTIPTQLIIKTKKGYAPSQKATLNIFIMGGLFLFGGVLSSVGYKTDSETIYILSLSGGLFMLGGILVYIRTYFPKTYIIDKKNQVINVEKSEKLVKQYPFNMISRIHLESKLIETRYNKIPNQRIVLKLNNNKTKPLLALPKQEHDPAPYTTYIYAMDLLNVIGSFADLEISMDKYPII